MEKNISLDFLVKIIVKISGASEMKKVWDAQKKNTEWGKKRIRSYVSDVSNDISGYRLT